MKNTLYTLLTSEGLIYCFFMLTPETIKEVTGAFTIGCQATIAIAAILKLWFDYKKSKNNDKKPPISF